VKHLNINYVKASDLKIPEWKATYILRPDLLVLSASLMEFGFIEPIHVRASTMEVIDGSERLLLALNVSRIADAHGDMQGAGVGGDRLGHGGAEFFGDGEGVGLVADAVEDDHEFVAADAGGEVVGVTQAGAESVGDGAEHFIADAVAVDVVDLFEFVQIAEEHGDLVSGADLRAGEVGHGIDRQVQQGIGPGAEQAEGAEQHDGALPDGKFKEGQIKMF
jgi:hypothetical protein